MNRIRTTAAVLATAGLLSATQLGLAGSASAAPVTTQATGCPISISYPSSFYVGSGGWVTGGGLYFGIRNKSTTTSFKKVTFTVTDVKNIRFGTATPKGGSITERTSQKASVYTKTFKPKAKLGFTVRTRLLSTSHYKVKFTLKGTGWNCATDQGTWGR
ncbi:hypothetical protein [Streptomyces sp. NPDC047000]|uniref:hypothetical protein n=1 Tax=Streptomyces sp. NPDC047000 TaxID=3155474 RepID=UPI0033DCA5CE